MPLNCRSHAFIFSSPKMSAIYRRAVTCCLLYTALRDLSRLVVIPVVHRQAIEIGATSDGDMLHVCRRVYGGEIDSTKTKGRSASANSKIAVDTRWMKSAFSV